MQLKFALSASKAATFVIWTRTRGSFLAVKDARFIPRGQGHEVNLRSEIWDG